MGMSAKNRIAKIVCKLFHAHGSSYDVRATVYQGEHTGYAEEVRTGQEVDVQNVTAQHFSVKS